MQAIILAGGEGSRLRPYTTVIPKPLMPVGDLPILEIILRQLKAAGILEVILAVNHLSQMFEAFFQSGDRLGIKIKYSFEDHPLGTAGPIAQSLNLLNDDVLVMNGDILTTLNYQRLIDYHKSKNAAATLCLSHRREKIDYGVVETDGGGVLQKYIEKPVYSFDVSMGIYMINTKSVSPYLASGEFMNFPDLLNLLRDNGHQVYCYREDCIWMDIGRLDDCMAATDVFNSHRQKFLPQDL